MVTSNNQSEVKVYLCGSLVYKEAMLKDLGIETLGTLWTSQTDMVNQVNKCTILVTDEPYRFEVGYMYARMQVYDTFENLPKERKPQLVIIREETGLADIIELPTWEAFLRWLKG